MSETCTGRALRTRRLYRRGGPGLLTVPLDHPVFAGPSWPGDIDQLVATVAGHGADAVILHKGTLRRVNPTRFRDLALVLHLNASTRLAPDPEAKVPVATVEEALRLGADAVSVHVNLGSSTEDRQLGHLAAVAGACDRWGVPLLAMMYADRPERCAHALAVAVELGADLVKTALPAAEHEITRIIAGCPVPVLAAGGAAGSLSALATAVRAGAGGVAAGRLVFTAPDPGAMVRELSAITHDRALVAS
ncbi:2-amino-4,5-dihydroxy-6-one-heptanoic acid-7-phosphate synthase [Actinoplanes sp. TFC3]|uniref:2-amino-4,5-dihydroxy-6-one-heptanoic acid-7-phosphate synthase n=1 Tax=Actinoplanes sp. TFC3 TaxID=1710355 RepID=UPI00082DABD9|nr:2-amino-4,5-dihydroxy-6-one-heptanoic acid-7-phosphate synthase [Actinoplanes sp. TFC3]